MERRRRSRGGPSSGRLEQEKAKHEREELTGAVEGLKYTAFLNLYFAALADHSPDHLPSDTVVTLAGIRPSEQGGRITPAQAQRD